MSPFGPDRNVTVLEPEEGRVPPEEEVNEYAEFLGIDIENEPHLMWIAREGVVAPVPAPWRCCTENEEDVFYFNFETAESVWDHPCDDKYRSMVEEERSKHTNKVQTLPEPVVASASSTSPPAGTAVVEKKSPIAGSDKHGVEVVLHDVSDGDSVSSADGARSDGSNGGRPSNLDLNGRPRQNDLRVRKSASSSDDEDASVSLSSQLSPPNRGGLGIGIACKPSGNSAAGDDPCASSGSAEHRPPALEESLSASYPLSSPTSSQAAEAPSATSTERKSPISLSAPNSRSVAPGSSSVIAEIRGQQGASAATAFGSQTGGDTLEFPASASDAAVEGSSPKDVQSTSGGGVTSSISHAAQHKPEAAAVQNDSARFRSVFTLKLEEKEQLQDYFHAWGEFSRDTKQGARPTAGEQTAAYSIEAEIDSLNRCLAMLREIRQKQSEYLRLLKGDP